MNAIKENRAKFLTAFATLIGGIIAIASLTTMPQKIAFMTIALLVILGIILGVIYLKQPENAAMELLTILFKNEGSPPVLEVRVIRTEDELRSIAELDKRTYGKHSVDYKGLLEWWQRYQQGIYVLLRNSIIIGAAGIWPLTKYAFGKLIAGDWEESKIGKNDICKKIDKHMYWYFGDIILEKKYRGRKYEGEKIVLFLLKNAAKAWLEESPLTETVDLCAIGATRKGVEILDKLGFFYVHRETPDRLPIYRRTARISELVRDFENLPKRDKSSQSTTPTQQ